MPLKVVHTERRDAALPESTPGVQHLKLLSQCGLACFPKLQRSSLWNEQPAKTTHTLRSTPVTVTSSCMRASQACLSECTTIRGELLDHGRFFLLCTWRRKEKLFCFVGSFISQRKLDMLASPYCLERSLNHKWFSELLASRLTLDLHFRCALCEPLLC